MKVVYEGFGYGKKQDWKTRFWLDVLGLRHAKLGCAIEAHGAVEREAAFKLAVRGVVRTGEGLHGLGR